MAIEDDDKEMSCDDEDEEQDVIFDDFLNFVQGQTALEHWEETGEIW